MTIRVNWPWVVMLSVCGVSPLIVAAVPGDPRTISSAVGFTAFVMLAYQFAHWYPETPLSTRVAVILILMSLLGGAIGQGQLAARAGDVALTYVTYPLIAQRVGCVLFAVFYRHALLFGTANPWVKSRAS